eukprot:scaffold102782_cov42-Phaeocystis_antarctica.AAC.1
MGPRVGPGRAAGVAAPRGALDHRLEQHGRVRLALDPLGHHARLDPRQLLGRARAQRARALRLPDAGRSRVQPVYVAVHLEAQRLPRR